MEERIGGQLVAEKAILQKKILGRCVDSQEGKTGGVVQEAVV